jgi:hypothetical protein
MSKFLEQVRAFEAARRQGDSVALVATTNALAATFRKHVDRATGRYPEQYFEADRRDEAAIAGIADRLLAQCTRPMKRKLAHGEFSFSTGGRSAFETMLEDGVPGDAALAFVFYGHTALLRDQLRGERNRNTRASAEALEEQRRWTEIRRLLEGHARRVPGRVGRQERWWMHGPEPTEGSPLVRRIWEVFQVVDRPMTQAVLISRMFAPVHLPSPEEARPMSTIDRIAMRRAVLAGWDRLSPEDQALYESVARARTQREACAESSAALAASTLNDAIARVGRVILEEIRKELDLPAVAVPKPAAFGELIRDVLLPALEERAAAAAPVHREGLIHGLGLGALYTEGVPEPDAEALYEALFHPALAAELGLGDEILGWIGNAAWQADPARAIAEAEYDEGLWVEDVAIVDD